MLLINSFDKQTVWMTHQQVERVLVAQWEFLLWCMVMKTIKTGLDSVKGQKGRCEVHQPDWPTTTIPVTAPSVQYDNIVLIFFLSLLCTDDQPHQTKKSVSYARVKWMENIMLQWPLWFEWDGLADRWYENSFSILYDGEHDHVQK